jgi:hypothetical protein
MTAFVRWVGFSDICHLFTKLTNALFGCNAWVVAIAINKRDLPNPMTVEEVETKLRVADLPVAIKQTFATAATTGDGLYPMFEWISEQSELKAKGAAPSQPAPKPVDEKPKTPQEELMERWLSVQDEVRHSQTSRSCGHLTSFLFFFLRTA